MRLRKYRLIASGTSVSLHLTLMGLFAYAGVFQIVQLVTEQGQASIELVAQLASVPSAAEPEPVPIEVEKPEPIQPPKPAPPKSTSEPQKVLEPTVEPLRKRSTEPVAVARKVEADVPKPPKPVEVTTSAPPKPEPPQPQRVQKQQQPKREAEIMAVSVVASPPSPASVNDEGAQVDELPREAPNNPAPRYPAAAIAARQQGRVMLRVRTTASGTVESAQVAESSGFPLLDQAALQAVTNWRFAPARRGGEPVPFDVLIPIRFQIR